MERRVIDLETRIAYQDKLIAQLDEVVREFADRVVDLERRVRIQELSAEAEAAPAGGERPPHY